MGFLEQIATKILDASSEPQQRAVLDETYVEHRYHKQRQYTEELEAYADALSSRIYQLENENAALREELKNMTVAHSIDEMIDAFREEGEKENTANDINPFASVFSQIRKNDGSTESNGDASSEGVADNMMNPDEYRTNDNQHISDIITQAHNITMGINTTSAAAIIASNPDK